jgi:hypothetical protein
MVFGILTPRQQFNYMVKCPIRAEQNRIRKEARKVAGIFGGFF